MARTIYDNKTMLEKIEKSANVWRDGDCSFDETSTIFEKYRTASENRKKQILDPGQQC